MKSIQGVGAGQCGLSQAAATNLLLLAACVMHLPCLTVDDGLVGHCCTGVGGVKGLGQDTQVSGGW